MLVIQKRKNADFTVLNLTDIQIYINDVRENSDKLCFLYKTVDELVRASTPDLITVSGDISNGDGEEAESVYRAFADYINGFGIPWTVVWGNHDNQGGAEKIQGFVDMYSSYQGFIYEAGDPTLGNGNFVIKIYEEKTPVSALIMLDTHDRTPYEDKPDAWGRLSDGQLEWYREQTVLLSNEGFKSNAIILHIPIYAYREAYAAAATDRLKVLNTERKISFEESKRSEYWNDGYKNSYGVCYEGIASYPADEGMMDIICDAGSTRLVLCGHDHVNSWSINYRGTELMYSLKTGQGCYFLPSMNGGTVLKINSNGDIKAEHMFVFTSLSDE